MGLPVDKLLCASNKNRVLADFFSTGTYSRNREFFRTNAPSMDILISSNLERFLYAMTGGDSSRVTSWYDDLARSGSFTIDDATAQAINDVILSGWIDEPEIRATIQNVYNEHRYVCDTHTAVGIALHKRLSNRGRKTIIASTASPYKFSCDVLGALEGETAPDDEFVCIDRLAAAADASVHAALSGLRDRPVLHHRLIDVAEMRDTVLAVINEHNLSRNG
jgi:threonine synthase